MSYRCEKCGRKPYRGHSLCWRCYKEAADVADPWRNRNGNRRGNSFRGTNKHVKYGPENAQWKGDAAPPTTKRARAQRLYALGDCERCGAKATDRHHIDGDTGNNVRANLMFLCRRCHMTVDGRLERLVANRPIPEKKGLRPCANCTEPTPFLNRGRCGRCAAYFWRFKRERPSYLFSVAV